MADSMGPLAGIVVVDASQGVAGGWASRLLADLGARVVKVEPPGGDRLRALGPFPGDVTDRELGGLHLALNAGKESVVADLGSEAGRAQLRELVAGANIFIEPAGAGELAAAGLDAASLLSIRPSLVVASHSPFGLTGPYAGRTTAEIVDYAMGGYMNFGGDPERHPLMVPGHQAELHAGTQLALGSLLALWHARRTGAGQHVDVSTFESMLNAHAWLVSSWTHEGEVQQRTPSQILPCADGHFYIFPRPDPALFALIERTDLIDDPRFATVAGFREAMPEVRASATEWAATRTKKEIYHAAQELRVPVTPVNTAADLDRAEQLAARGWWRTVVHPETGELRLPGPPWLFSATPASVDAAAPLLGSADGLALPARDAFEGDGDGAGADGPPLDGLRVLEVTANWAGPLTGRHLGDMGADVIKLEVASRPATRAAHPAGGEQWTRPYNRSGYFNYFNRNKRDLVVDLATEQGREIFLRMAEVSDVVLENNSARVFPNLGLEYETIAARNPRIVMCSMSGFGATGPEANYVAFGSNVEASSGLVATTGYGEGDLFGTGTFYADPVTGSHGTIAILAALIARERTGEGQYIDMALHESGASFQVEALMDYQLNGRVAGPSNNRSRRLAPQGVYRSVGSDCWLAVGVEDDEQWRALCEVIGRSDLAARYPDLASRLSAHDEIDAAIEAWSVTLDHNDATVLLQAAGVPAGPVLAAWEIVSDPHLYERDYFVDIVHPEVGHHRWVGYPWKLSRTPGRISRPSPLFGEHNDEVLSEVLGLGEVELAELRAQRVIADEPDAVGPAARRLQA
ncbi:MAG: CoA transferase [Dehalococcoidia bacterium]|jgi:crotonobetainyl-CoA:carnitine CoA-transferase CaiB-like acyl-CoA transferase|nr:CoA transferase [Dehalococcoidia bacterium]